MASWRPRALTLSQNVTPRWMRLTARCVLALALLPAVVRAQDVFNGSDNPNIFGDAFSSSCTGSHPQTVWKQAGVNPLTCHAGQGQQNSQGQCTLYGKGTTVVAHISTTCYYCSPNNPPGEIYIPMDQVSNASKQGFLCGDPGIDPGCMAVCWRQTGGGPYVPPSQIPTTGGGTPSTLDGRLPSKVGVTTTDPCHPYYDLSTKAGQQAMQANAVKDAAACLESRCQHNPTLQGCVDAVVNMPTVAGTVLNVLCPNDDALAPVTWPAPELDQLKAALANAKDMLTKTKARIDKTKWDPGTQAIAALYFGASAKEPATQNSIRAGINGMLAQLNQMSPAQQSFYPAQGDMGQQEDTVSYVHALRVLSKPKIFLTDRFWNLPATGADSKAAALVHESSHFLQGGATGDPVYGQQECMEYAMDTDVGHAAASWHLPANPLHNASSFQYFVYEMSQMK